MLERKYSEERRGANRFYCEFGGTNNKGEKIVFEYTKCVPDLANKYALPNVWKKYGYIDRVLESYWCFDVCVTDEEGYHSGRYNPQVIDGENKINFDWMLEATQKNKEKIIDEIYRRATA